MLVTEPVVAVWLAEVEELEVDFDEFELEAVNFTLTFLFFVIFT